MAQIKLFPFARRRACADQVTQPQLILLSLVFMSPCYFIYDYFTYFISLYTFQLLVKCLLRQVIYVIAVLFIYLTACISFMF